MKISVIESPQTIIIKETDLPEIGDEDVLVRLRGTGVCASNLPVWVIIAGYHQDGLRSINMQVWNWKGIDVINAHERDPQVYIDGLKEAIKLTGRNVLQPDKFITHYIDFSNINNAFKLLKERPEAFLKAVITY